MDKTQSTRPVSSGSSQSLSPLFNGFCYQEEHFHTIQGQWGYDSRMYQLPRRPISAQSNWIDRTGHFKFAAFRPVSSCTFQLYYNQLASIWHIQR